MTDGAISFRSLTLSYLKFLQSKSVSNMLSMKNTFVDSMVQKQLIGINRKLGIYNQALTDKMKPKNDLLHFRGTNNHETNCCLSSEVCQLLWNANELVPILSSEPGFASFCGLVSENREWGGQKRGDRPCHGHPVCSTKLTVAKNEGICFFST